MVRLPSGKGRVRKWRSTGLVLICILTENFKFDLTGTGGPVPFDIPGYPVDLIGGDGHSNFGSRSIRPSLWNQFVAPTMSDDSNGGSGVVGIKYFKV